MKRFVISAFLSVFPAMGMADDFAVAMPPIFATLYPQGAMVLHETQVDVPQGQHRVSFLLPLNPSETPHLTVAGATPLQNQITPAAGLEWRSYLTQSETAVLAQYDTAQQGVWTAQDTVSALKVKMQAHTDQAAYLRRLAPGSDGVQNLEKIAAVVTYLPKALAQNAADTAELNRQLRDAEGALKEARNDFAFAEKLLDQQGVPDESWALVSVDVLSDGNQPVTITSRSFAPHAGWAIAYDAHLTENAGTIDLDRTARVFQNTGQAWEDVTLRLSSSEPLQQINPVLPKRDTLDVEGPMKRGLSSYGAASAPMLDSAVVEMAPMAFAGQAGSYDGVAVTFDYEGRIDMPTGQNLGQSLPLEPLSLSVETDRFANARHDDTAFVRTKFVNDTGQPILAGSADFYRDGVFIGKDGIETIAAGADHILFFGPDKSLPIDLKFLSNLKGDEGFLARSNTREEEIAFSIQNLGPKPQSVVLSYALPISVHDALNVDLRTAPRPTIEDANGEPGVAEWHFDMPLGQRQNVTVDMKISWPDGTHVDWQP